MVENVVKKSSWKKLTKEGDEEKNKKDENYILSKLFSKGRVVFICAFFSFGMNSLYTNFPR